MPPMQSRSVDLPAPFGPVINIPFAMGTVKDIVSNLPIMLTDRTWSTIDLLHG